MIADLWASAGRSTSDIHSSETSVSCKARAKQNQAIKNTYKLKAFRICIVKAGKRFKMWSEKDRRESGSGLFQRNAVMHTEQM
jgi:hypothetical protein